MTGVNVFHLIKPLDLNHLATNDLPFDLVQNRPEKVLAQHPDNEQIFILRKSLLRPFNKFCKIIQKCCLQFILTGPKGIRLTMCIDRKKAHGRRGENYDRGEYPA